MPQTGGPINVPKKRKVGLGRLAELPKTVPTRTVNKARKVMKKRTYKAR